MLVRCCSCSPNTTHTRRTIIQCTEVFGCWFCFLWNSIACALCTWDISLISFNENTFLKKTKRRESKMVWGKRNMTTDVWLIQLFYCVYVCSASLCIFVLCPILLSFWSLRLHSIYKYTIKCLIFLFLLFVSILDYSNLLPNKCEVRFPSAVKE